MFFSQNKATRRLKTGATRWPHLWHICITSRIQKVDNRKQLPIRTGVGDELTASACCKWVGQAKRGYIAPVQHSITLQGRNRFNVVG